MPARQAVPDQVGASLPVRALIRFLSRRVYSTSRATVVRYYRFLTESNGAQLADVAKLVDNGMIRPVIDQI